MQAVLLLGLSLASGYRLPDFSDADWTTVLFLTPWGLIQNHLSPSAIGTFYGEISKGQTALDPVTAAILGSLWLLLAWNGFKLLGRVAR